ncbi:uncharacterized protein LOC112494336 [Cephus cinctus]|uniref:Uncharacterized protein LOC112494336 n=1 Tax=Cephus cinctus TaxID=211228 RepID=A0AAJ7RH31_CEPCN|nr:uncharacterized protein LOC112494336 [Cephus cinctus]
MNLQVSEKGTFEFPKARIGQCTGDMIEECYTRNNTYGEEDLQPCQNSVNLQFESSVQDDGVENSTERISEKSQEQITVSLGNPEDPNSSEYHNCKTTRAYQEEEKRDLVSRKGLTPVTRPPWSEMKGFGKEADAKKVRSLTLGRMGKMMMMRKSGKEKDCCDPRQGMSERAPSDLYKDQISMKERANSLGRMLKLVDKDGAPRKLFSDHRAGSLTGIFYKKNNPATATVSSSDPQAHSTGIFAKVLSQLRGRGKTRGHHGMPEDNTNMDENKGLSKENYLSRKSALASRIMGNLTLGGSKKSCSGRTTNPEHSERDTN